MVLDLAIAPEDARLSSPGIYTGPSVIMGNDISSVADSNKVLMCMMWSAIPSMESLLKIKCNVFSFVEVNFSPSVFNTNKSI